MSKTQPNYTKEFKQQAVTLFFPSGQRLRRSDGNPASLKSSEIGFSFMKKTKVLELFALSRSGFSS